MFRTWMNTSSVGRTRSRPFVCEDAEVIVEDGGRCEINARVETERKNPNDPV